jgi:hypothetical protein
MRGFLRIPLLAIGTVLGYGFAFHSMHHHRDAHCAWERHFSDVGVGAARSVKGDNVKGDNAPPKTESPEP